jgi:DMSO/TMAO reductase YedYZ molybdopterin-dependent catalytic subunit
LNTKRNFSLFPKKKTYFVLVIAALLIGASLVISNIIILNNKSNINRGYPDFITKTEDYFISRIGNIPNIDPKNYRLNIWGQINNSKEFTLNELRGLNLIQRILTTECIGNYINGPLVSTAIWKGFLIYDLIESLGLKENATGVKFTAADGYYTSQTLEQLKNNGTIGALYMNGKILPPIQGFPLRVVNPGAYGAKQPAWVIDIEVIDKPMSDYWDDRGWDTSPPMEVDSKIFFPSNNVDVDVGVPLEIGGAAYGGRRISKIEYTINGGKTWDQAVIIKDMDLDHVWVFWKITIMFESSGTFTLNTKATDINGNAQPKSDSVYYNGINNGINSWPLLIINVMS